MSTSPGTTRHPREDMTTETVSIPVPLLQRMLEAARALEVFQDELEGYLLSQDADFLARMRQARSHHLKGETRSLDLLKQELCIE